jgi:hypothetical protein
MPTRLRLPAAQGFTVFKARPAGVSVLVVGVLVAGCATPSKGVALARPPASASPSATASIESALPREPPLPTLPAVSLPAVEVADVQTLSLLGHAQLLYICV